MNVLQLVEALNLTVFSGSQGLNKSITGGYTSDLLSDVMGNADEGNVWITLQTHKNVMAIAQLKDLAAVILVKGLNPDADTLAQSEAEGIPMLGTDEPAFEINGKVYQSIIKSSGLTIEL